MAKLVKCKTCGNKISTNAKSCPSCGDTDPFTIKPKNGTRWKTIVYVSIFTFVFYSLFGPSPEETRMKNLEERTKSYEEKVSTIKKLEKEVKKIPASNYEENYRMYEKLFDLNSSNEKYKKKLDHYKALYYVQEKISKECRISSRKLIKSSLSHPSSYDYDNYNEQWRNGSYYYEEYFFASNSFGVKDKMVAQFKCTPVKKNGKAVINIKNMFFKKTF